MMYVSNKISDDSNQGMIRKYYFITHTTLL